MCAKNDEMPQYTDWRKTDKAIQVQPKTVEVSEDINPEFLDTLNAQFAVFDQNIQGLSMTLNNVIDVVNKQAEAIQYLINKEHENDNKWTKNRQD